MTWWRGTFALFTGTYSTVWNDLGAIVACAMPAVLAFALAFWSFGQGIAEMFAIGLLLLLLGQFLATMLLNALHRRILDVDAPPASLWRLLPAKRDWKAFGALCLLTLAGRLPAGLLEQFSDTAQPLLIIALYIGWLGVLIALLPRLMLLFPVIAMDRSPALQTAWRQSRGTIVYFWPVMISILLLAAILFTGTASLSGALATAVPAAWTVAFSSFCFGLLLVLLLSLMTSLTANIFAMKQPTMVDPAAEVFD